MFVSSLKLTLSNELNLIVRPTTVSKSNKELKAKSHSNSKGGP